MKLGIWIGPVKVRRVGEIRVSPGGQREVFGWWFDTNAEGGETISSDELATRLAYEYPESVVWREEPRA